MAMRKNGDGSLVKLFPLSGAGLNFARGRPKLRLSQSSWFTWVWKRALRVRVVASGNLRVGLYGLPVSQLIRATLYESRNSKSLSLSQVTRWTNQNLFVPCPTGKQQHIHYLRFADVKRITRKFRGTGETVTQLGSSGQLRMASLAPRAVHGLIDATHSKGFGPISSRHSEGYHAPCL